MTNVSAREAILKIADRAIELALQHGNRGVRLLDVAMALTFVHSATPLKLKELLEAPDVDFAHDVFGILMHIDTGTGKLDTAGFCPKYLVPA